MAKPPPIEVTQQRLDGLVQPTAEQAEAVAAIQEWWGLDGRKRVIRRFAGKPDWGIAGGEFLLDGGAGTGKTTTVGLAVKALGLKNVVFGAYTAKAARVMQSKGMADAATLHSLLYRPEFDDHGVLIGWRKNDNSPCRGAQLIVVDEVSMCPESMADELRSFEHPILVLGDVDGQLPPIKGTGAFLGRSPDFRLTELHRTLQDSPIARLAWLVRRGAPLRPGGPPEAHVAPLRADAWGTILNPANQVICGKHRTRFTVIRRMREKLGAKGPLPQPGEPILCRRNDWRQGFINGEIATIWRVTKNDPGQPWFEATLLTEDGTERPEVRIGKGLFAATAASQVYEPEGTAPPKVAFFDWAYAITCHSAQGTEFESVVVIDDLFAMWDRDLRRRWLYTAFTRARQQLRVFTTG